MTFHPLFEDRGWIAAHLLAVHAGELAGHLLIAILLARTIYIVTQDAEVGVLAGGLFLVNAFAVPAICYATAWREMTVCGLAVVTVFALVSSRSEWRWLFGIGCAGCVLAVKPSAAAFVALPVIVWLTIDWEDPHPIRIVDWIVSLASLAITAEATYGYWGPRLPTPLFESGWIGHALVQSTAVLGLTVQSMIPYGITEQFDWAVLPWQTQIQAAVLIVAAVLTALFWIVRRRRLLAAFGILWIALAIGPRILVHTKENIGAITRAPEVIYGQQWYPALPGVIWILVSFVPVKLEHR